MGFDSSILRIFACVSLVIGAVECFAGFKIMKAMLVVWGFFIGTMLGVIIGVSTCNTVLGFISVLLLGIGLAILAYKLYLAGIFILIAFLSATAFYVIFQNIAVSALLGIGIGVLALIFVKPVVVLSTAFSGAGIILSSAYLMMDLGMNAKPIITGILWVPIAITGVAVQYITTQPQKTNKTRSNPSNTSRTFSERKYPGMQRAYRNFCIKCGYELQGIADNCPRCGFSFDD